MTGWLIRYLRTFTGFSRDARMFLLTTLVFGAVVSLYWVDFNLYLDAIGLDRSTIGWLMAAGQLAAVLVALPASSISNRLGRRNVMVGGVALVTLALFLFLPGYPALLFAGVVALGAGTTIVYVVQVPYIAERTSPEHRNEYFATWSATSMVTMLIATMAGGAIAQELAPRLGMHSAAAPYVVLLAGTALLGLVSLASVFLLADDRPDVNREQPEKRGRFGLQISDRGLFFRLLLPGFLTSLGAGQLIPFLNLFVQTKFGLGLAAINALFAITSLGTALAIMLQPAIARRFGRIGSIVMVQGTSIPFLLVLGFSPVLWTVAMAMLVRNSLMNAGGPIFDAFAMERVSDAERATLSALMTLLWSLGWTIAPLYYGVLQGNLSFTAAYSINFLTCIVLYTIGTSMLWIWFRDTDRVAAARQPTMLEAAAAEAADPVPEQA